MRKICLITLLFCFALSSCNSKTNNQYQTKIPSPEIETNNTGNKLQFDTTTKTIHIFVALCDNKYQGIVPVPAKIGNGQDPKNNLYWGCEFGIRTYLKNSKEWELLKIQNIDSLRLERLVFKHSTKNYYLVADAYDGKYIKQCTKDFLLSSCGQFKSTFKINNVTIGVSGNSRLVAYIGHNGLMDFQLTETYQNTDQVRRDIIILACYSKRYFSPHLKNAQINPIVWTQGLMAPEAYTIHDALTGYINNENNESIRTRAISAYSRYQKCSIKAARNLLVTGW